MQEFRESATNRSMVPFKWQDLPGCPRKAEPATEQLLRLGRLRVRRIPRGRMNRRHRSLCDKSIRVSFYSSTDCVVRVKDNPKTCETKGHAAAEDGTTLEGMVFRPILGSESENLPKDQMPPPVLSVPPLSRTWINPCAKVLLIKDQLDLIHRGPRLLHQRLWSALQVTPPSIRADNTPKRVEASE